MTWREFVTAVEDQGVQDDHDISFIDVDLGPEINEINVNLPLDSAEGVEIFT